MPVPKILLVDDVKLFLEMEKDLLKDSQVQVLTATDGEMALDIVRKERPDLIIMDMLMPKMDGVACCTAIKGDPALNSIPVIIFTNGQRPEDVEKCMRAGCDDFLIKPVDGKYFLEKVRKFLPGVDRRKRRACCRVPVTCTVDGAIFTGMMEDLSLRGLYVATDALTSKGSEVGLAFHLPTVSAARITARGRVIWLNGHGENRVSNQSPGFGVEFLEITGEGLITLRTNELKQFLQMQHG